MECSKRDHIPPLSKELHWLPIHARIEYKVILVTFKCLNNLASCLFSADKRLLVVAPSGKKHYKNRSIADATLLLRNKLPERMSLIDSTSHFKTALKTLFFTRKFINL